MEDNTGYSEPQNTPQEPGDTDVWTVVKVQNYYSLQFTVAQVLRNSYPVGLLYFESESHFNYIKQLIEGGNRERPKQS